MQTAKHTKHLQFYRIDSKQKSRKTTYSLKENLEWTLCG